MDHRSLLSSPWPRIIDDLHIRLLMLDDIPIDQQWDTRDVCDSFWRLYINNRDGAGVRLDDGFYELPAGAVHIIPAWVHFSCCNRRAIDHFYVHFDVIGLPGPVVREVFARPFTLGLPVDVAPIRQRLRKARQQNRPVGLPGVCQAKSLVYLAMADLLNSLSPADLDRCQGVMLQPNPLLPALQYVDQHLGHTISTADLARLCHLSPDHFTRRFHQQVGQPPRQYLLERRITMAAERLLFGDDTIEQISQDAGFANRFHFSRAFVRRMGVPPAAYRNSSRVQRRT